MSNATEFQAGLDQFAEQLRRLREERGGPVLKKIVSRADGLRGTSPLSTAALSEAFSGKRLQRMDSLMSLVHTLLSYDEDGRQCAVDRRAPEMEAWRTRWRALDQLRTQGRRTGVCAPAEPIAGAVSPMAVRALADVLVRGRVVSLTPFTAPAESYDTLAFSPDGRYLALGGSDGSVYLRDPATGEDAADPLVGHQDIVRDLAFSGDGRRLASVAEDGTVWLWDLSYRNPVGGRLPDGKGVRDAVAVSPDGRTVAAGGPRGLVHLWDTATRELITTLNAGFWSEALGFSPDGALLAAGGSRGALRLWSSATWAPAGDTVLDGCYGAAFSPDGSLIAVAGPRGSVGLWDPLALASGPVREVSSTSTDAVSAVAFSPDGRLLAGAGLDGTVRLWHAADGLPLTDPLETPYSEVYCVAFSPDGGLLAAVGDTDVVQVWIPPHGDTG
ncbi:WD40 repeat domain-containing protein [Streptomyces sp. ISL-43]|uniref:WD40 repeat domain-containing protein n=1 Tax=Streptomyces sp. ISL-43 TaxID=2819183 RepID=UPI001BE7C8BC|nr:WD40 repeat domain-containing protein [Streptomyces sp. ISL-43]MBT2447745.1 WD40 repeat domain-containing protein [Streptomyces sp. ISL-43]